MVSILYIIQTFAIKETDFSIFDLNSGADRSLSISLYPLIRESPKLVGTNFLPCPTTFTYSLSHILLICTAIEASVPIPCFSMRPINSLSERKSGGVVLFYLFFTKFL